MALDAFDNMEVGQGYLSDTTISQMELLAPTQALLHLSKTLGATNVIVYCDSQYVVKGCNDRKRARNKNKEFWKELDRAIGLHKEVMWIHIRGHAGHLYNEMADKLAVESRKEGQVFMDCTGVIKP